jgi:hypothetical protein
MATLTDAQTSLRIAQVLELYRGNYINIHQARRLVAKHAPDVVDRIPWLKNI